MSPALPSSWQSISGARVITTASAANHEYLRTIGADEIIDYNAVDFTKVVTGCDAVFDTVGGDVAAAIVHGAETRRPRGLYCLGSSRRQSRDRSDVIAIRPSVGRDRPHLERIVALVENGAVRPPEVTLLQAQRSRGRAPVKRIPPLPWQAGLSGPLRRARGSKSARTPSNGFALSAPAAPAGWTCPSACRPSSRLPNKTR